jgi:hypothetical protein
MKQLLPLTTAAVMTVAAFNTVQAQQDLVYVAVEPCRVADTRDASMGFIRANTVRDFRVYGTSGQLAPQGGKVECLDPKSILGLQPVAVAAYIVATPAASSTGRGALSVYSSDLPPPPSGSGSTVNFAQDQTIGNTTIATICSSDACPTGGELAVLARGTDEHVVIDVQGYFYRALRPTIQIVSVQQSVALSGATPGSLDANCPAGTQLISGGGFADGDSVMADSYPLKALSSDKETWSSSFVSRTGDDVDATISTIAVCVSGFNPTIVFAPTIAN